MPEQKFETDEHGNIVVKPVVGWTTVTLAQIGVLLAIQYADSPEEIETPKSVQFALTAPQCLELAEVLTRRANAILQGGSSGRPN